MDTLRSRLPGLTTIAWIVASILAFIAFLALAPVLLSPPTPTRTPTAISIVSNPSPSAALATPSRTNPPFTRFPTKTMIPSPTTAPGANRYTFVADPTQSGYVATDAETPRWGDRNLHAGFFNGQVYQSVLLFDLAVLPPNSDILYANLQLTGLSRDNLANEGEWRVSLIQPEALTNWKDKTSRELLDLLVATQLEPALGPADLDLRMVNQFVFKDEQLPLLEHAITGSAFIAFRVEGPAGPENNLFTWDGGGLDLKTGNHPTLQVVAVPGSFTIITNTPEPQNVVTAAALALRATADATRFGTPTPFPRNIATATPIIIVTALPTAENLETRVAVAQHATAVALTTGTFTPTPENWVVVTTTPTPVATPTPLAIPIATLDARLSPTAPPTRVILPFELLQTPVPDFLRGNIIFLSDRYGDVVPLVMRPDGTLLQALTGTQFYDLAQAREPYNPDRTMRAIVTEDSSDVIQVWILDLTTGAQKPITQLARGLAYDPVWSPDGGKIAYVSRETGSDEIYVYDLGTETTRQITFGGNVFVYKQRPSWSPDSSKIIFKSNQDTGNFQIWIMNADGSDLRILHSSRSNDTDPVWVK